MKITYMSVGTLVGNVFRRIEVSLPQTPNAQERGILSCE